MSNVPIGYVVLAKRPARNSDGFRLEPVGAVHETIEPCENHQAYCSGMSARDYPNDPVEYVIGVVDKLIVG